MNRARGTSFTNYGTSILRDLGALTQSSCLHGGRKTLEDGSFGPCGAQVETVLGGIKING